MLRDIGTSLAQFADRPMLIAWGLGDPVFDRAMLDEWRRRFPAARTRLYPGAGHYLLEDAHADLVPAIRSFLRTPLDTED